MLTLDIEKTLSSFTLRAHFASSGHVTALFGPSGAGKTSLLHMIAGLSAPDRGRIVLGERILFDSEQGIDLPVHQRRVGYVFQDARLFPHLNVRHNLDYGRRMNRLAFDPRAFDRLVDLFDLAPLLERRIGQLSGGERQRVALGRALLSAPRVLLLDEPLASLDAARKKDILPYLVRLRDETAIPMIYVSHDLDEVRVIADHIVRIVQGQASDAEPIAQAAL